jgi:hypothetical protein
MTPSLNGVDRGISWLTWTSAAALAETPLTKPRPKGIGVVGKRKTPQAIPLPLCCAFVPRRTVEGAGQFLIEAGDFQTPPPPPAVGNGLSQRRSLMSSPSRRRPVLPAASIARCTHRRTLSSTRDHR